MSVLYMYVQTTSQKGSHTLWREVAQGHSQISLVYCAKQYQLMKKVFSP